MKRFQLSRYVKKWLPLIIAACFILTAGVFSFLRASQTYLASAVIRYEGEDAEEGLTPSGTELDVNEIKSSAIMSQVITNLKLDTVPYSVDDLISRVKITEIIDEDEKTRKEALLDEGEEYEYEPVTYVVSFEARNDEGKSFARRVLDEILDLYFAEYSEKYVNQSSTTNSLSELYNRNYDYFEMMEIIEEQIDKTIETLVDRTKADTYFRSSATGKSFTDFTNEFNYIKSVNVSKLYSQILKYQITKNKTVLISNYTERIKNYNLESMEDSEVINDILTIIDSYVTKMRDSDNTNITFEYILDEVYDDYLASQGGEEEAPVKIDQTVSYDKLIYSWRDNSESREYAVIDTAYSNYIIDTFSRCTGADGGACQHTGGTCSANNIGGYDAIVAEVDEGIRNLVDTLEVLYREIEVTNQEYNEYLGAQNISMLSTASVTEGIDVMLYTAIAAVFLLIVCCCGAILLGRLNDIIQYVFYTDHLTGFYNRTAFDSYLRSRDRRLLNDGTLCAMVHISNQVDINKQFGRDNGDLVIKLFADTLKEVFNKTGAYQVYNGNGQFIIVVEKTDTITVDYILNRFRLLIDDREEFTQGEIVYKIGIAETFRDNIHVMRGLLSKAMQAEETYHSESPAKADGEEE